MTLIDAKEAALHFKRTLIEPAIRLVSRATAFSEDPSIVAPAISKVEWESFCQWKSHFEPKSPVISEIQVPESSLRLSVIEEPLPHSDDPKPPPSPPPANPVPVDDSSKASSRLKEMERRLKLQSMLRSSVTKKRKII